MPRRPGGGNTAAEEAEGRGAPPVYCHGFSAFLPLPVLRHPFGPETRAALPGPGGRSRPRRAVAGVPSEAWTGVFGSGPSGEGPADG
ncbi:hypothetical protein Pve01_69010 [Planomonospora venezuelensis]|nr:hypothetical protein Pve01_69010 [Planomonospora venezuelensis]